VDIRTADAEGLGAFDLRHPTPDETLDYRTVHFGKSFDGVEDAVPFRVGHGKAFGRPAGQVRWVYRYFTSH
jgi:hypothetical protein